MNKGNQGRVLISNGHGRFHLIYAAKAVAEENLLDRLITGAYPAPGIRRIITPLWKLTGNPRLKRWMMREVEGVDKAKIAPCNVSEVFYQLANRFPQFGCNGNKRPQLDAISLRLYQREALRHVKKSTARIYHCRAGYGGRTIEVAREKGMVIVVDHSIPHPYALMQLVEQGGYYEAGRKVALPPMWEIVLEDIERADYVLANSDFVRNTLADYFIDPRRVRVLYLGLDPQFETLLATQITDTVRPTNGDIRFMFAGGVNKRKGAVFLLDVFEKLPPTGWELTIAGGVEMDLAERIRKLKHPRIQILGVVLRDELARLMRTHHVFVFPTLAEGSARVVTEAMASGMAIITTPNCGSVVENGKHGWIVPPGNPQALRDAVQEAIEQRELVFSFGQAAQELVRSQYHSGVYKQRITQLYRQLLSEHDCG